MRYFPQKIESKWQKKWLKEKTYEPSFVPLKTELQKRKPSKATAKKPSSVKTSEGKPFYNLMMFPYPSAEGLHVGNMYAFTGADIYGRFKRMQGYDVFEPIGLDGFGIHSENYALKIGKHPMELSRITEKNFYRQLQVIGNGFAWDERLETYDPEYYKWTQWIFVQMFKRGLAYRKKQAVNWCPSCKTVLADEQVIAGKCERCDTVVIKKELEQWFFKITDYAERLLKNLEKINWSERVKIAQRNWIGRSEGALIKFSIFNSQFSIEVFTTRPDTLFGATYLVVAPEHPIIKNFQFSIPNFQEVEEYIKNTRAKTEEERIAKGKEKTGVELKGIKAVNPANGEKISIWVADYALGSVGTGAIMAVPAHDERDFEFAKRFDLPIQEVVEPLIIQKHGPDAVRKGVPFTERNAVVCIVKHWAEDKYLCLKWKKIDWRGFVVGGIEDGEDVVDAVMREIREETGYTNVKFVRKLGGVIHSQFYHVLKNQNRLAHFTGLYLELKSGKCVPISQVEQDIHDIKWLTPNEAGTFLNAEDMRIFWGRLQNSGAKYKCVLVHGCPSKKEETVDVTKMSDKHWIPWIREELTKINIKTYTPLMPEPWKPVYEEWKREFEKIPVDENTILIGHSCAAAFLVRWLGETQRKVKKLILVAGAKIPVGNAGQSIKDFYDFLIDDRIKNNVGEVVIFISDNEEERHKEAARIYVHALGGRIMECKGKGHFIFNDMGTNAFPELLEEIIGIADVYTGNGILINSGRFSGMDSEKAKWEITKFVHGKQTVNYRLRDWLISRQRYWGSPIPMIFCKNCAKRSRTSIGSPTSDGLGWHPVPESDLPVKLPRIKNFRPTGTDKSPLASVESFYKVRCPKCKSWARRETDVSDTFLDSAWYFLRYPSVREKKRAWNPAITKKWLPVDSYIGGAEHSVLHLLYARFLGMVFSDWGLINFEEPFTKFRAHGLIIKDGAKMSKSKGNVVNPDEYIRAYGADALRMYLMFLGPFEQGGDFRDTGIRGITRFLERTWKFTETRITNYESRITKEKELSRSVHKTIKKVTEDIENLQYNTAISALMILLNEFEAHTEEVSRKDIKVFLKLLAPFAPYISEELWEQSFGNPKSETRNPKQIQNSKYKNSKQKFHSIHLEPWPKYDAKLIQEDTFELVIQVNGKMRGRITLAMGAKEKEAKEAAMQTEQVRQYIISEPRKTIFVPNKLINFVI